MEESGKKLTLPIDKSVQERINALKSQIVESQIKNISYRTDLHQPIVIENKGGEDLKAEWKSILTDFNVNNLFGTNEDKSKFLDLIFKVIDDILNTYKKVNKLIDDQLIFFYKGGNILRILANHISMNNTIFRENFANFFKKSDDDFSIIINIDDEYQFNRILRDVNAIIDQALVIIRDQLQLEKPQYFDYFTKSRTQKEILLRNLLSDLQKSNLATQEETPWYGVVFDAVMLDDVVAKVDKSIKLSDYYRNSKLDENFDPSNSAILDYLVYNDIQKNILVLKTGYKNHLFYNYFNTSLTFEREGDRLTSFDLFRTKANFRLFYHFENRAYPLDNRNFMELGGELIDISIPKFKDSKRIDFCREIKKDGLEKFIKNYQIKNIPKTFVGTITDFLKSTYSKTYFTIRAVTIDYLLEDLETMLFMDQIIPWTDKKYAKRIARLFFIYVCKSLQLIIHGEKETGDIHLMFVYLIELVISAKSRDFAKFTDIEKNLTDTILKALVEKIHWLYFVVLDDSVDFAENLENFSNEVLKYTNIDLEYLGDLARTENIKYKELTILQPELFGGYLHKYYKYHQKYRMLRNKLIS